jgi:hypothetical protein
MSVEASNVVCKHIEAVETYLVDLGPMLASSETVAAVVSVTSDDPALVISNAAVIGSNTETTDSDGDLVTIEANTGVRFDLSGGTLKSDSDFDAIVTVVFKKSSGNTDAIDCRLRVRGRDV